MTVLKNQCSDINKITLGNIMPWVIRPTGIGNHDENV